MYQVLNGLETQERFSQLYSVYFMKMLRFSQAYVGTEEDAKNIVQDVFLYLWEHIEVLDTVNNTDAFLFTLIKNRCLNFIKHKLYIDSHRKTLQEAEEEEMQMNLYALEQFDENLCSVEDMEHLLQQTIDSLPERCRRIFMLSRMDGLKYKEIAARLEISVNTVENQMSIALKKIRLELKEYLPLLLFTV